MKEHYHLPEPSCREGLQENLLEEPLGEEHPRVGTRSFLIQPLFLCGKYKMSHQKEQPVIHVLVYKLFRVWYRILAYLSWS